MMKQAAMGISEALAAFACGEVAAPATARAVLRLSLADWMAVGIAGAGEPVARVVRAFAAAEGGRPEATLFGGGRAPARMAALVNGTISHALDFDDTHFAHIGHPSVAIFPAALSVAEAEGATGEALQAAALIGMEGAIRFGLWLGRSHYAAGFHQTATSGAVGAALAAGRLMGLMPDQIRTALGLVATRASGLRAQFGTMGKPFNAGLAAANGVEAALLARLGMDAQRGALDGPLGFGATHHGAADAGALAELGRRWMIEEVSHKLHACCHGLHAALEAAREIAAAPGAIEAIRVETHPRWMNVCNQAEPETGLGAKFSYATVLAMHYLGHDTARRESFSDALCADDDLRALRRRVSVCENASLRETEARLDIALASGAIESVTHDLAQAAEMPERRARLECKLEALLGAARAAQVWACADAMADPTTIAQEIAGDAGR